eukprot:7055203-Lingulodinium_polyedra.AAC.1
MCDSRAATAADDRFDRIIAQLSRPLRNDAAGPAVCNGNSSRIAGSRAPCARQFSAARMECGTCLGGCCVGAA